MTWAEQAAVVLENDHVVLSPIVESDREPLRKQALDPSIWHYFVTRIDTDADFDDFFSLALTEQDAGRRSTFCVTDKGRHRAAGTMSYFNMAEADRRLEIGWSWLGTEFQGTGVNRWSKYLLLRHAFEQLEAERVEFRTDALNTQARRGLVKIGATEEGTFRSYNPMPGGRRRDAVFYSILKAEWPDVKARLEGTTASAAGAGSQ